MSLLDRELPSNFEGKTYVAFTDISGFKNIILGDINKAYKILRDFYTSVLYEDDNQKIARVPMSDCVVTWLEYPENKDHIQDLLNFLTRIHTQSLKKNFLVSSTIVWGDHKCEYGTECFWREIHVRYRLPISKSYIEAYQANDKIEKGSIVLLQNNEFNITDVAGNDWRWSDFDDFGPDKPKGREYFWSALRWEDVDKIKTLRKEARGAQFETLKKIYRGDFA